MSMTAMQLPSSTREIGKVECRSASRACPLACTDLICPCRRDPLLSLLGARFACSNDAQWYNGYGVLLSILRKIDG